MSFIQGSLKIPIQYVRNFFSKGNVRTLRAKKNISVSFISKIISIVISFIIVPLTLGYVGKVEYGIWMTISAIINWFTFFDIGLGNGLRNKLAEALALNDQESARIYISSSYAIISIISFTLFIIFLVASFYISWNAVLNTDIVSNVELRTIILMVFFFFCIGFVMSITSAMLQAMQKYAINDIISIIAQFFGLAALFILIKTTEGSLFYLCLVYGSKTAIVLSIATFILFNGYFKAFRPSLKFINIKKTFPLLNLGLKFFANQVLYLILNQTALLLVVQFFGPGDVTVFNLAVRYMTIVSMGYMMILTPFLSAFTEAYTKKDFAWIKITIRRINLIWLIASCLTILLTFGYKTFFKFWVGDQILVPFALIISLAISSIIGNWGGTYGLFLNGIGKINLQLYLLLMQAIFFIPLSYLFYKLGFGLVTIVAAQIILHTFGAIFVTIQSKKIVNQTATGIWAK